jgi:SAM-dependent methyltransferase
MPGAPRHSGRKARGRCARALDVLKILRRAVYFPRRVDTHYFTARYTYDPGRERVWRAICEYLQPYIPPAAAVLELGAGYCDCINQIRASEKFALDANADVAKYCAPGVTFLHAGAGCLPLDAASIDVIIASNFLEHLHQAELDALFADIDRVLKPRGALILIQPNMFYAYRRYWDDYTHVKAFSHVSLADFLVSRGFTIAALEKRFLPLTMKSALPKSYWLTRAYLSLPWRPLAGQMLVVGTKG